ncbi:uncharacterized protein LOC135844385 [Planococcus citri]|uniref:uncharacterized protein LOC135844385 n=1 Tax=Planococcus citri TaxID=170843 RepID=UPI0031F99900
MMLLDILCLFSISICFCNSQNTGGVTYLTRWRKMGLCAPSEVISFTGGSTLYGVQEYWNGIVNVTRDFTADKGIAQMEKCGEGYYPCEKFFKLEGGKRVFENLLNTPNQAWSTLSNAINPKITSSRFKKGIYTITNATLDIEKAMLVMPEFPKYYWKLTGNCSEKGVPLFCFESEFHVFKYTQHDRKRNG